MNSNHRTVTLMYALMGLGIFGGWVPFLMVPPVIALMMAFIKSGEFRGSYLDSHVNWIKRTGIWYIVWSIVIWTVTIVLGVLTLGLATVLMLPMGLALFIWSIYRVLKGWMRLNSGSMV